MKIIFSVSTHKLDPQVLIVFGHHPKLVFQFLSASLENHKTNPRNTRPIYLTNHCCIQPNECKSKHP